MNADPQQLRRDIERTKRLSAGLNDELSAAAARRYVDELTAELRRHPAEALSSNDPL